MKKFKFLFLIALVATMFIGCAQPIDDDTPIISDAQPTVEKVTTAYKKNDGSISFFKTCSVTYSDHHVDKYEIITTPANVTRFKDNHYYVDSVTLRNEPEPSQIDFFNGTPLIVTDKNKNTNEIEFKFSEIYTKVE